MPYDSVYSEKRPPGTLRTAWRKFDSDASGLRLTASTSNFSVINYCRRHGRAMAKFLSSWGLTTSDAMF